MKHGLEMLGGRFPKPEMSYIKRQSLTTDDLSNKKQSTIIVQTIASARLISSQWDLQTKHYHTRFLSSSRMTFSIVNNIKSASTDNSVDWQSG